jgi:Protein of unknown function (DUF2874).
MNKMKKLLFLLAIMGLFMQVQAQEVVTIDVPTVVKDAFQKAYPTINDVAWSMDGNSFVAEYDVNKVDMSVTYTAEGKLIETEMEISVSSLPQGVMEYILKNYKEEEVTETLRVTDAKGIVTYKVEISSFDLIFDSKGNFIKSVKA